MHQDYIRESRVDYLNIFVNVMEKEAKAIQVASQKIQEESLSKIIKIYDGLLSTGGCLVFSGVGKSGIVAQKMSSTFSSLGLPSYFLHPTEALHGDLGRLRKVDALVMISKSGTTEELIKLFPYLPMDSSLIIGLLGQTNSPLAKRCGVILDCSVEKEACLNDLAPTTSTTVALSVGDALAVVYEAYVGLSKEAFAMSHPGGILGKSLRLKVSDLMIRVEDCPMLGPESTLQDVIFKMTEIPLGICLIATKDKRLLGIMVEGDIRRALSSSQEMALKMNVKNVMNATPVSIHPEQLAFEALNLMEGGAHKISVLPVVEDKKIFGIIRLHDLFKVGFLSKNP